MLLQPVSFTIMNLLSVGREGSLLPIQEFQKRGALRFLVVGKPQNVGWGEGTVQLILQKSYLTLG